MRAYDKLIDWLSEQGSVSQSQLDRACDRLWQLTIPDDADPLLLAEECRTWRKSVIWSLLRLGHLERSPDRTYHVPPPTVLGIAAREGGFVLGTRSEYSRQRLRQQGLVVERIKTLSGPSVWWIEAPLDRLQQTAHRLDWWFCEERGADLLASLPPLTAVVATLPEAEPIPIEPGNHWEVMQVERERAVWRAVPTATSAPGFYRLGRDRRRTIWITDEGRRFGPRDLFERKAVQWTIAPTVPWHYDAEKHRLEIPDVGLFLPLLVERALTMPCGCLPKTVEQAGRRYSQYLYIDPRRAVEAARILNQEFVRNALPAGLI